MLCYNRQNISGDASVRLKLGTKEWKVVSCLICQMGTYSKTSNVLMRIIFVFSPPPRSIKETLLQRNSSTLNTSISKWQKEYYKMK